MNIHVEVDAIDYQKSHHAMNELRSWMLLERLRRFHGDGRIDPVTTTTVETTRIEPQVADETPEQSIMTVTTMMGELPHIRIQYLVSEFYGITRADLVGASKRAKYAIPRQVAMYLIYRNAKRSWRWVGMQFGGRDHTTIRHAVQKIEGLLESGHEPTRQAVMHVQRQIAQ